MPKTLSLLAVLKKVDAKGVKSLSNAQWDTFLASDTEPNEIGGKIKKLEGYEEKGAAYDKQGELIVEDNQAMIDRFKARTGRASGRESLKAKRSKIDVASFKKDFLNKKEEPVKPDVTGAADLTTINEPSDLSKPDPVEEKETEGLKGIRDVLDDILKVLRLDFKGDRKEARDMQKEDQMKKRTKKEDKLEGGIKKSVGLIGKSLKAIVSPFSEIWDAVIKFLKFTLIGVLFNKTLNWFGDPKNQKKAERIGKFFKDWWPALATAAALFLTPLGALVKGVVGLLTAIIPKLVIAIAANPYAALALVGTGLAVYGMSKLAGEKSLPDKAVDESVDEIGSKDTINQLKEEQENRGVMGKIGDFFTGAGAEREQQIERVEGMGDDSGGFSDVKAKQNMGTFTGDGFMKEFEGTAGFQEFNKGGKVRGQGDKDTVPSMLTPGEFVMSKGAVQKYGENTLAAMNTMGGGTNKLEVKADSKFNDYSTGGVVQYLQGGGSVNKPQGMMRWLAGAADYMTMGLTDFDKRGSMLDGAKRLISKEPVETPIPPTKNTTITLPTIPKNTPDETVTSKNDIPQFRISMMSTQRSMVISSLGIQDLVGGE